MLHPYMIHTMGCKGVPVFIKMHHFDENSRPCKTDPQNPFFAFLGVKMAENGLMEVVYWSNSTELAENRDGTKRPKSSFIQ